MHGAKKQQKSTLLLTTNLMGSFSLRYRLIAPR